MPADAAGDSENTPGADLPAWLQVELPELPPTAVRGTVGRRRILPRQHKAFTAVAAAVAALVLLLTATTGHAQPSDVASISVTEPVQWEWPVDGQEFEVPWCDSLWDDVEQPRASAGDLWKPTRNCIDVWYTELGFPPGTATANEAMPEMPVVSTKKSSSDTTASETMAKLSGASAKHTDSEAGGAPSPPITREKWFPTLRYEAIVKPAGPATLRTRLNKEHGYGATLAQVTLALDVIRPDVVDSGGTHAPPPEGNTVHTAGRLPDTDIDTPWPHKTEYAAATRGNVERFTCLGPIEKFEPPAHHKRLKFELKEGMQMPRMRNPRPTPVGLVQQLGDFCKGLKSQGRIINSTSPIASPVLIIPKPKKNPTDPPRFRFVIDYRSVNTTIVPHSYRLPTCDSLWYTLDNATYISTADAADGYWLAPLDPETAWLTAFDTPEGRHEWTCLPMGIQPASGWYQSFMEDLLARNNLLYTGDGNRRRNPDTGQWENFVIAYQDDLIWWSDTEEDHHEMTELFLDTFSREKLYLNPNKLNLCCKHTRYLGCIVGNGSLSMDPRKVDAVIAMSTPADVTGVRQLLGMCQFYRRWVPAFSSITAPLTDMLKKGVDFATAWGKEQDDAVATLKTAMSTYPVLRQFDPTKPVVLLADASTTGLGGCLAQHHDGILYPVSYSSHRLTAAEQRYPITELEGLAILHLVRSHRHFLVNNPFTIRVLSDHQPLQWVQKVSTRSGRLARWLMELSDYDFRIEFIPGKVNDVADALSRLHAAGPADATHSIEFRDYLNSQDVMSVDIDLLYVDSSFATEWDAASAHIDSLGGEDAHITKALPREWRRYLDPAGVDAFAMEQVQQHGIELSQRCNAAAYAECPSFAQLFESVKRDRTDNGLAESDGNNEAAGDNKEAAGDTTTSERGNKESAGDRNSHATVPSRMKVGMYVVNGSLFTASGRLCVPTAMRRVLIVELHENNALGHRGSKAVLNLLQARVYWPSMERDVREVVAACDKCGDSKATTTKHWGPLRPHMPPTRPFTHYSIDFMFGFPKDGGGPMQYDGIMVCVDMFSKRVVALPVWEAASAEVMAEQFYRKVVCSRGCMMSILSDRDVRFTSAFWRKLWALHHTSLKMTPAYAPQADGQTERMNRVLEEIMRANVQADQLNWLELLDGAVMAVNNAPIAEVGQSPFEIESGLAMRVPLDTQSLMDQTHQNRGSGGLVRDNMIYDDDGILLDLAPYPGIYEVADQAQYMYDHPERMRAIHQLAREQMVQAKIRMAKRENANRPVATYAEGDYVRLSLEHVQLPVWAVSKCRKLRGKYFGAFPIVAVHSPLAIQLRLPPWLHKNIHPVFHPMYLKPATTTTTDGGLRKTLGNVFDPADYVVEGILAHRTRHSKSEYLVQWEHCSYLQSTWEPESGLVHAQRHLSAYKKKSRKIAIDVATVLMEDPSRPPRSDRMTRWVTEYCRAEGDDPCAVTNG